MIQMMLWLNFNIRVFQIIQQLKQSIHLQSAMSAWAKNCIFATSARTANSCCAKLEAWLKLMSSKTRITTLQTMPSHN